MRGRSRARFCRHPSSGDAALPPVRPALPSAQQEPAAGLWSPPRGRSGRRHGEHTRELQQPGAHGHRSRPFPGSGHHRGHHYGRLGRRARGVSLSHRPTSGAHSVLRTLRAHRRVPPPGMGALVQLPLAGAGLGPACHEAEDRGVERGGGWQGTPLAVRGVPPRLPMGVPGPRGDARSVASRHRTCAHRGA
ncbi:hypothetical protein SAMN05428954_0581 [Streptomyces sp. 2112.3]|nr:hypothetical protein SAMN05428954_0581 [Streptomyces sp. 2112.3]